MVQLQGKENPLCNLQQSFVTAARRDPLAGFVLGPVRRIRFPEASILPAAVHAHECIHVSKLAKKNLLKAQEKLKDFQIFFENLDLNRHTLLQFKSGTLAWKYSKYTEQALSQKR